MFDFINKILSPYSSKNIKSFFIIDISKDNNDGFQRNTRNTLYKDRRKYFNIDNNAFNSIL